MTGRDVSRLFVSPKDSIADVIAAIDRSGRVSLALLADERGQFLNTLTDGDVRRGILAGLSLEEPVSELVRIKARTPYPIPVTAPADTDPATLLQILRQHSVRQLPLVDANGAVVDIVILNDFQPFAEPPFRAVVMAGGQGVRLRPLTDDTPKPMLPVGGRPLLEFIVEQLRDVGVKRIHVTTHYQAEKIIEHFGTGESFGVDIKYVREDVPLGTGGALGLLERPDEPVLVINGDILTQVDFRAMFAFHQEQKAEMTVGVRRYDVQVPYGVVDCDGVRVRELREKPQLSFFVNAGIYLLEPSVFELIPANQHSNITDVVTRMMESKRTVVSYPICEYWLDIGEHDDYQKALKDAMVGKLQRRPGEHLVLTAV
jgi:dTDP-glucose pyrophosphorylase/CBS domain-containing protein